MENDNGRNRDERLTMEEPLRKGHGESGVNLGAYFTILRMAWWKILLVTVVMGVLAAAMMLRKPNIYSAVTIITPAGDEGKQAPALGALASFGIMVGGPTKVEDLETLFKSNDLTVRVFRKYDLWRVVLADRYDAATGNLRSSWTDLLLGRGKARKPPGDWDAIRAAKDRMRVSVNRRGGTLSLSFESPSPEGSAAILKYYLEEGKSRLQEEAFERAERNKKFIQEQIARTVDALTRDRLYSLYGQEVEREMLARNREQFGFKIIDSPRVPDRKVKPLRTYNTILAAMLAFVASGLYFIFKAR